MFDRLCIKRRSRSPRVNNNNEEDAAPTNDAAANQDDGDEGMDQPYLQPINAADIPDKVVLLGLASRTQAEMNKEPPNAAYRFFNELLDEACDKYRNNTKLLCQIVTVSSIMLSEEEVLSCIGRLTFGIHYCCILIAT